MPIFANERASKKYTYHIFWMSKQAGQNKDQICQRASERHEHQAISEYTIHFSEWASEQV